MKGKTYIIIYSVLDSDECRRTKCLNYFKKFERTPINPHGIIKNEWVHYFFKKYVTFLYLQLFFSQALKEYRCSSIPTCILRNSIKNLFVKSRISINNI